MKIKLGLTLLSLLLVLSACQQNTPAQPLPTSTPVPGVNVTPVPPSDTVAPAAAPSDTPAAPSPTAAASSPTAAASSPTATASSSTVAAPTNTPSSGPTASSTKVFIPRPTATSAGPLSAQVYVANCRSAPTADKPGNVIVQISVEAKGGNGVYQYTYNGITSNNKFIDIAWEKGTHLLGKVTVTSGDGQTIKKDISINIADLTCP